jgi:hypothetical protein
MTKRSLFIVFTNLLVLMKAQLCEVSRPILFETLIKQNWNNPGFQAGEVVKKGNGFSLENSSWLKPLTDLVKPRLESRGYKKAQLCEVSRLRSFMPKVS